LSCDWRRPDLRNGDDAIVSLWTAAAVADLRFVQTAETVRELAMNGLLALRSAAEVEDVPRTLEAQAQEMFHAGEDDTQFLQTVARL